MRIALLSLLMLTACGVENADCVTSRGVSVNGASCDEVEAVLAKVELEAVALGYGADAVSGFTLNVVTSENGKLSLTEDLFGQTSCKAGTITVSRKADQTLITTALPHELFHAYQACVLDQGATNVYEFTHPHWSEKIVPAIRRAISN